MMILAKANDGVKLFIFIHLLLKQEASQEASRKACQSMERQG